MQHVATKLSDDRPLRWAHRLGSWARLLSPLFFLGQSSIEFVQRGVAGEIGGEWVKSVGAAAKATEDETTAEHDCSTPPFISHEIAKLPGILIFPRSHLINV